MCIRLPNSFRNNTSAINKDPSILNGTVSVRSKEQPSVQPSLQGCCPITETVERLACESGAKERGAIYTRREVADFILDLAGYTTDQPLTDFRLLEPSCGGGDLLCPAVERLLTAAQRDPDGFTYAKLAPAIRGVELHHETFERTRIALQAMMIKHGVSKDDVNAHSAFLSSNLTFSTEPATEPSRMVRRNIMIKIIRFCSLH